MSARGRAATVRASENLIDTLIDMGFPRNRVEKALVVTGYRDEKLAVEWLVRHAKDPEIDLIQPRQFVVYLSPADGPLRTQLEQFALDSERIEWNKALEFHHHVTVTGFFTVPDKDVPELAHIFRTFYRDMPTDAFPSKLHLQPFFSDNFVGLRLPSDESDFVRRISKLFAAAVKKHLGIEVPLSSHDLLHLSLAYGFPAHKLPKFEELAKKIDVSVPNKWTLRLFSRDPCLADHFVMKVRYKHKAASKDELTLHVNDFIYVRESELLSNDDGWYYGTSWCFGTSGRFPGPYTKRVCSMDTWTLHRSVMLLDSTNCASVIPGSLMDIMAPEQHEVKINSDGNLGNQNKKLVQNAELLECPLYESVDTLTLPTQFPSPGLLSPSTDAEDAPLLLDWNDDESSGGAKGSAQHFLAGRLRILSSQQNAPSIDGRMERAGSPLPAYVNQTLLEPDDQHPSATGQLSESRPRRIFLVRHGERVDFAFGANWLATCFDSVTNEYRRTDFNLPSKMPVRENLNSHLHDSPLTELGRFQAKCVGRQLASHNVVLDGIYSSPSLRCLMTANEILKLQPRAAQLLIRVEPALFEWGAWYRKGMPEFLGARQLVNELALPIDLSYRPLMSVSELQSAETCSELFQRNYKAMLHLLSGHEGPGQNMLAVVHACSMTTCSYGLMGRPSLSSQQMVDLTRRTAYCHVSCLQERFNDGNTDSDNEYETDLIYENVDSQNPLFNNYRWHMADPLVLPLQHGANMPLKWQDLVPSS